MTVNNLDDNLKKILFNYADVIRTNFTELSDEPATQGDLCELGKQTFYVFTEMCDEIIKYLDSN